MMLREFKMPSSQSDTDHFKTAILLAAVKIEAEETFETHALIFIAKASLQKSGGEK